MRESIDQRQLITLESVARLRSFAAAADELAYTQSAVSQQISEIERRIGMRVVERRPVKITQAGKILLDAELSVRTATAKAIQALASLNEGLLGDIKLGAFTSAAATVVPPVLARFRERFPDVQVILNQLETQSSYARLLRGDLDLALTFDYDKEPRKPPASISRTLITEDPVYAVLPFNHPLAANKAIDLNDLAADNWIGSQVTVQQLELIPNFKASAKSVPELQFAGDNLQIVLSLIEQGLGVALLPKLTTLLAPKGVIARPIVGTPLTRYIYSAKLRTAETPAALSVFERQIAEALSELVDN